MPQSVTVTSPLEEGKLLFQALTGREELGRLFTIKVDLLSPDPKIEIDKVLGQNLTITAEFTENNRKRYFNGDVVQFRQTAKSVDKNYCYEAILKPRLWFLTRTTDCKIFQKQSVPDIIKAILDEHGITDVKKSLSGTYKEREYCVQYNESDFDFISRLMEEEGIYYFFEHAKGKHTLVLADADGAHSSIPGDDIPFMEKKAGYSKDLIYDWNLVQQVESGLFVHTDYDFTKPRADLKSQSKIDRKHGHAGMEVFEFPGGYTDASAGETIAKKRIEEQQTDWEKIDGQTNCVLFATGMLFKMSGHAREDQNTKKYLLTATNYELKMETSTAAGGGTDKQDSGVGIHFDCSFEAIDSRRPFRSASVTPRPVVPGPQTAVVVGKSGEEIWTDQYGRVKVQFFWDRLGKKDENSSCWLRVAQAWAGKGWGIVNIPRLGEEVIVEFLSGDPDQPIVTGRVYNAEQTAPYTLPDNQTQSGAKSRSTKEGDAEKFNELRFEDKKGEEQVYFHAEKDFSRVVENNDTLKVGFDEKDAGDQTIEIYNNRTASLEKGNDSLEVKEGNQTITITKGNQTINIAQGNQTIEIKQGNQSIKIAAGKGMIEAATELTLKVGESTIVLKPDSISLSAVNIKIEASGQLEASGAQSKVVGSGMLDLDGGVITMN